MMEHSSPAPAPNVRQAAMNVIALNRLKKSSYCDHSGWGTKQGSMIRTWKRRFFVLKGQELIYYVNRSPSGKGVEEKGRLRVVGIDFTPEFTNGLLIRGELKNQVLKMQVETNEEAVEWHNKVQAALLAAAEEQQRIDGQPVAKVAMEGWLWKEGQNFKTWKRRYMTLCGRTIKYHANPGEPPLGEAMVNDFNLNSSRSFALDIYSDNNRIFRIAADTFDDIDAWDRAIAKATRKPRCFGDIYASKSAPFLGETFEQSLLCEGWLYKRGKRSSDWRKRYFTLRGANIQYHDSPGANAKGAGGVVSVRISDDDTRCLEIELDTKRWLSVSADSVIEYDKWINALCVLLKQERKDLQRTTVEATRKLVMQQSFEDNDSRQEALPPSAFKRGWLLKEGKRAKTWKRRYFVLENKSISYYEQVGEAPRGQGTVAGVDIYPAAAHALDIILTTGRVLRVAAESNEEIRSWLRHLRQDTDVAKVDENDLDPMMTGHTLALLAANRAKPGKGWLLKMGKTFRSWKRRYFKLEGSQLSYFDDVGQNRLGCGIVRKVAVGTARPFCIDITFHNERVMPVAASNEKEWLMWCKVLYECIRAPAMPTETTEFDLDDTEDGDGSGRSDGGLGLAAMQSFESVSDGEDDADAHDSFDVDDMQAVVAPNASVCSGWLNKEGGTIKTWKKRFFILHSTTLSYFKTDTGPLLRSTRVCHVVVPRNKKLCIEITISSGRKLMVAPDTSDEFQQWLHALHNAIEADRERQTQLQRPLAF